MNDEDSLLLGAARDRIATSLLGGIAAPEETLGDLRLRPHQASAVARLMEIIGRHRGALLADAVGLGKTYVGLAVARQYRQPLIVCPASLRPMWRRAMAVARVSMPLASIEGLGRGERVGFRPDFVLVDEAHHLRTRTTRRYQEMAGMCRFARVLLMTATPLQNSRRDLTALLGLFAGSRVEQWSDADLSRLIVRRDEHRATQPLPPLSGPHPLSPGSDDDLLDAILALPPAVPAADEGAAHALTTMALVHLWSSSRAALLASIRKRRARAVALREAIAGGHMPTAAELATWQYADETLQLALPFCVSDWGEFVDVAAVSAHLDRFVDACSGLIELTDRTPNPDETRVKLLRSLRARHSGDRLIAFSQYARTVEGLGRLMRRDCGVATITSAEGRIASGAIGREAILSQFAGGAAPTRAVERIDLLVTTDLLSEGVDLRGAAVVIHLDLPWNPARLEQRVGRARRIGSTHDVIHAYTFVPPAAADRMLRLQERLATKARLASAVVGGTVAIIGNSAGASLRSPTGDAEELRARVAHWIDPAMRADGDSPVVAGAASSRDGWIAIVTVDGMPRMLSCIAGSPSEGASAFLDCCEAMGAPRSVDIPLRERAVREVGEWMAARRAVRGLDEQSTAKRAVLDRLGETVARSPRHRRPAVLDVAERARRSLATVRGVGAERILATLARSPAGDDAWLQSVESFGAVNSVGELTPAESRIEVIVVLVKVSPADGATRG